MSLVGKLFGFDRQIKGLRSETERLLRKLDSYPKSSEFEGTLTKQQKGQRWNWHLIRKKDGALVCKSMPNRHQSQAECRHEFKMLFPDVALPRAKE